jgi:hypothetical protein
MQEPIDLTLAVNYLPACFCIVRLIVYMTLLSVFTSLQDTLDHRLFIILLIIIYMDRIIIQGDLPLFFDGSAILLHVFLSNIYQHLRGISDDASFQVLIAYFAWCAWSGLLLWDSSCVPRVLQTLPVHIKPSSLYTVTTSAFLLFLLFHTTPQEPYMLLFAKGLTYGLLAIMWIYVVALHDTRYQLPSDNVNIQVAARFLPILVMPVWMAGFYTIYCFVVMLVHCRNVLFTDATPETNKKTDMLVHINIGSTDQPLQRLPSIPETPEELDTETLFRMAKEAAGLKR